MPATNSVFADAAIDDVASASLPLLLFPLDLNDGGGTHGTSMRLFRHLRDPNFDVMFNALHLSDIITDEQNLNLDKIRKYQNSCQIDSFD
jgi:hypothetical protein